MPWHVPPFIPPSCVPLSLAPKPPGLLKSVFDKSHWDSFRRTSSRRSPPHHLAGPSRVFFSEWQKVGSRAFSYFSAHPFPIEEFLFLTMRVQKTSGLFPAPPSGPKRPKELFNQLGREFPWNYFFPPLFQWAECPVTLNSPQPLTPCTRNTLPDFLRYTSDGWNYFHGDVGPFALLESPFYPVLPPPPPRLFSSDEFYLDDFPPPFRLRFLDPPLSSFFFFIFFSYLFLVRRFSMSGLLYATFGTFLAFPPLFLNLLDWSTNILM